MSRTKSTRYCSDCGQQLSRPDAIRCASCNRSLRAVTPLYEPNTTGLCRCGCGRPTPIAKRDDRKYGIVKGSPIQFLTGHHRRLSPVDYVIEDRGYTTPCWIWKLALYSTGYGQFSPPGGNGRHTPAHVEMYQRKHGPVPDGLQLDHLCRVRSCCNPDHLEPVTCQVNLRRGAMTRLTCVEVLQIRALEGTMAQTAIGKLFGVSGAHICNILQRKYWGDC